MNISTIYAFLTVLAADESKVSCLDWRLEWQVPDTPPNGILIPHSYHHFCFFFSFLIMRVLPFSTLVTQEAVDDGNYSGEDWFRRGKEFCFITYFFTWPGHFGVANPHESNFTSLE